MKKSEEKQMKICERLRITILIIKKYTDLLNIPY